MKVDWRSGLCEVTYNPTVTNATAIIRAAPASYQAQLVVDRVAGRSSSYGTDLLSLRALDD